MAYEIKERSLGETIDAAFQIYRNHFGVFLGVALCVALPLALAVSLVNWLITGSVTPAALQAASTTAGGSPPTPDLAQTMRTALATMLSLPLQLLGGVLQDAVLTLTVADAYLGRPVSVQSSFQRSVPMLLSLLGASMLKGLGVMAGFVCLIIPGIFLTIRWMLTSQAIVIESKTARESLGRSRELTADNYGRLALLLLVMTVLGLGLHFALQAILPDAIEQAPVLAQLLQLAPQIVVAPISSAALTLAYFDLRVRKEGFDLERLAQSVGELPIAPRGS